jgi:hypothetical protein
MLCCSRRVVTPNSLGTLRVNVEIMEILRGKSIVAFEKVTGNTGVCTDGVCGVLVGVVGSALSALMACMRWEGSEKDQGIRSSIEPSFPAVEFYTWYHDLTKALAPLIMSKKVGQLATSRGDDNDNYNDSTIYC